MPRHDDIISDWLSDERDYWDSCLDVEEEWYHDQRLRSRSNSESPSRPEQHNTLSDGYPPSATEEEHGYPEDSDDGDVALSVSRERHATASESAPSVPEEQNLYPDGPAYADIEHVYQGHSRAPSKPERQSDTESLRSIATVAAEEKAQLAKTIKNGIDRCKEAIANSDAKLKDDINDANQSFNIENELMNEWHERIKTQELILEKRMEIHVRLPTNQVVTPAHNALVDEDAKEGILIAESFRAVKAEKADIRARLASRIEKAEAAHARECGALSSQIACLRSIAELSDTDLDHAELDDLAVYESSIPVIRFQPSVPAESNFYSQKPAHGNTKPRQSNAANTERHQKHGSVFNMLSEDCDNCSRLRNELSTARKTIDRIQAAAPIPDMRKFIKHGAQILSELIKQYDAVDEDAAKQRENKKLTAEADLQDLTAQHSRIKNIYNGIGHLWEHENQDTWQKTWDMCREELARIKKEQDALQNLDFRCEEKLHKRQWNSKGLLVKQIKFFNSILIFARSEVANPAGDLDLPDSYSE